jgi:hypothetical protein
MNREPVLATRGQCDHDPLCAHRVFLRSALALRPYLFLIWIRHRFAIGRLVRSPRLPDTPSWGTM